MNSSGWRVKNLNIVDLLCTFPSKISFTYRVGRLQLPEPFEKTVLKCHERSQQIRHLPELAYSLSREDEEVLATEVLYYRHKFTRCVLKSSIFRQAALTVIQNIYLFQNRHIFFIPPTDNQAEERRLALELFSTLSQQEDLPVGLSLCHSILARVWARIVYKAEESLFGDPAFLELHAVVENLNTLRNIYILFSSRLVLKLAGNVSPVYRQSVNYDDRVQIGCFGIARAAYRYHPSCGVRFSTYAANWFYKEVQRQALAGRLIYLSANSVEQFAKARKTGNDSPDLSDVFLENDEDLYLRAERCWEPAGSNPEREAETNEQQQILLELLDSELSERARDIIRRRYGLSPYSVPQSIIEIAEQYGMTRGRMYQIEQEAFKVLRRKLRVKNSSCVAY
ncbi:sigma-70 family RNA polymerase sigma factor [Desulfopila aestuarii]|uniref:RNA polymerase sigma factor, sigma-70 family n=1 Tax=Desulfopila aestuarii DSM 18488 TaxID=1121416 RepID=A0A1M7YF72_9BACT|nr:sigma-70 family RNA polymerase sigma factor [Desulfopila aestuarii]SHO51295.1 RNA polymerase sigma factor, sigma-70 family [Desulfopila aestuarii DSM 18488]